MSHNNTQRVFRFTEKFQAGLCASLNNGGEGLVCAPQNNAKKCIRLREHGSGWRHDASYTSDLHYAGGLVE